jgi:hypothetical protein
MFRKFAEEILKKILEYNSKGNHESIPHSDLFEKEVQALIGLEKPFIDEIIQLLKDSHKIFIFEILKEDKENDIKRVYGYVEADLQTIRKLKNLFQLLLMDEYEKQLNKRLMVQQIIKDIYARPQFYKNTLLGQIGNKAIMLNEYELLMERNYNEFTDTWKSEKFNKLIPALEGKISKEKAAAEPAAPDVKTAPSKNQRAVDSPLYKNYTSNKSKQSLEKVLQIYGVDFFFRINLRKYEFDILREVLEKEMITRRDDLANVKNMIQKTKANIGKDPGLAEHGDKIYKLERLISQQMLYSH